MNSESIDGALNALRDLYEDKRRYPFPYDDCRALRRRTGQEHEHLIMDLDMYFSEIAGYSSWGKKILTWPGEKVEGVRAALSRSFFERHPEYESLRGMINESDAPDLHAALSIYDAMRRTLLGLLSQLSAKA